jgi:predicted acetyltransferase
MLLVSPDVKYLQLFRRFAKDYRNFEDSEKASAYGRGSTEFSEYVQSLRLAADGIGLPDDQVPYHTYWLIDHDAMVGVARIRPVLTPISERDDGHIGYDIAPSQRRKGYGTALLRLVLREARQHGLSTIILTCLSSNLASRKIIEKCGGVLLEVVADGETGQPLCRYKIEVFERRDEGGRFLTSTMT